MGRKIDLPASDDLLLEMQDLRMKEIAKKYNVSVATLQNRIIDSYPNFNGRKYFISKLNPDILYKEAETLNIHELSKKYKVSENSLRKCLKSKYPYFSFNEGIIGYKFDFFEIINTEEKAYWLGFFYADGCAFHDSYYMACLNLAICDIDHIKKFQQHINSSHKLLYRQKGNSNTISLRIYNKKMFNDLVKQGCMPNKTFILKFPTNEQVPENLLKHFIRGYFDGDGSLNTSTKNKQMRAKFTGNRQFIEALQKHLFNNKILKTLSKLDKDKNIYNLNITNKLDVYNLICYLYNECSIYLDRKYSLYKEYKSKLVPKFKCTINNCMNKVHNISINYKKLCFKHHYQNQKGLLIWE